MASVVPCDRDEPALSVVRIGLIERDRQEERRKRDPAGLIGTVCSYNLGAINPGH
jgi:hypothetical protein